ncbi:efflux RND transporter periplasmic adaptor subunit [Paenalcaligenes niemegkensis]|uniref:efflux RND transporter periplasmic adaptor subunit n=1 Tax=Paenalcaligenes niemegkensis TaxID=2895469 RepID=UPI001EE891DA|nr:efflux RND transporter periplasmic adaptor subunit [Paenalcaligenes niemegkensis]MCQ9615366.1 efflux RND transporter periplasmic adaptor subunit [Paenalcaligenes niemegkensis]
MCGRFFIVCTVLLGLLSACGEPPSSKTPPRPVAVVEVSGSGQSSARWLAAEVAPRDSTLLSFRIDGKIARRFVALGDEVSKGDLLAELDPQSMRLADESAQAQLKAARTSLGSAEAQLKRDRVQARSQLIAQAQLEQSESLYAQALAAYTQAQKQAEQATDTVHYGQLRADQDGVVAAEHAQTGQNVAAGQAVYSLAWSEGVDVVAHVPQAWVNELAVGDSFSFVVPSVTSEPISATLREVAPQADAPGRTFLAKFSLHNTPDSLRLGMSGQLGWQFSTQESGQIWIPATALYHQQAKTAVWRYNDQRQGFDLVPVTVAEYTASQVSVSTGLQAGDIVASKGVHTLSEHDEYSVTLPSAEDAS